MSARTLIVVGALGLLSLVACRAVVGVEELRATSSTQDGGGADASDAATVDAGADADGVASRCAATQDCRRCCRGELATAYGELRRTAGGPNGECACGPPASGVPCAVACAGDQETCPGSPGPEGGTSPGSCEGCLLEKIIKDTGCMKARRACEQSPACKPIADCLAACQ